MSLLNDHLLNDSKCYDGPPQNYLRPILEVKTAAPLQCGHMIIFQALSSQIVGKGQTEPGEESREESAGSPYVPTSGISSTPFEFC